ncbi:hypothetical protein HID58_065164 [Brassica napus]|uniref:DUF287 domain-containing protein n=1 Tax=Brassica napus TaxID=3708 RepID=A0ABQ7ZC26_BRANA|nr:hypothetical protein HID58_065164 [Brassica napus]
MAPKTRFARKTNKEGAPEKKKKNRSAAEKKKAAAVKRRREAVKKKRDASKKKTETAEKKRKQDSSSSESSSNPTKRRRTASSPEQHSDPDHSPAPSAELLSQDDREGTPSPSFPIEPQKAPTQTPSEAENPLQDPITSNNREDPNRESHSPEAAINNEAQRTVISSTLKPQGDELDLLYEIMDEGSVEDVELQDDSDKADIAVDGWNRILIEPEGKIFWEDLFEMDVRTRPTTQQQSEPHGIFEGQEEERVYNMGNGNEDGEAVAEKDGEKQVEEEAEKDGAKEAEKDGAKEAETTPEDADGEEEAAKEAYEVAGNEDEVGQKEGETEADKEGETEEGKTDVEDSPSTLQVMAEAAEKLEKEVDDKAAAEKAGDELAAAEKAASDKEKVGDEEETRPKRTHKPSRPLRSPYQKN